MISYIKGEIQYVDDNSVSVLANSIGWSIHVFIPEQYSIGQIIEFYVYTHFRESEISLWGFKTSEELKCFKMLISVSGVGPRTGQTLVGDKGVDQVCYAIVNNDTNTLKVPGVGLKTAQRIIIELKNKVKNINYNANGDLGPDINEDNYSDLYDALTTLGYKYNDIKSFVSKLEKETELTTEELIKMFLRSN